MPSLHHGGRSTLLKVYRPFHLIGSQAGAPQRSGKVEVALGNFDFEFPVSTLQS
jgi:hypothetical protein